MTLVTTADCHLCHHARRVLEKLSEDIPLLVLEVEWDGAEGSSLVRRDGVPFPPAIYVNGSLAGYGRLSERALRKRLTEARS